MSVLVLVLAVLGLAAEAHVPRCHLSSLQPVRSFNVTAFLGRWHAVADYNVQGKAFSKYVEPRDMQATFYRHPDGSLGFKTAAHLTLTLFSYDVTKQCFGGSGQLEIPDPRNAAHWRMAFNTWFPYSPASYMRDYYILATDYVHYAVLYTCWRTNDDGSCHPDYAFSWVLSRHHRGHAHKHIHDIRRALSAACLDVDALRDRAGSRLCPLVD